MSVIIDASLPAATDRSKRLHPGFYFSAGLIPAARMTTAVPRRHTEDVSVALAGFMFKKAGN
jgi:hypothetical protein